MDNFCRAFWKWCTSAACCCSSADARGGLDAQKPGSGISSCPLKTFVPCWFGLTQGRTLPAGELLLMPAETPDGFFQQRPASDRAAVMLNPSSVSLSCRSCPCLLQELPPIFFHCWDSVRV